ncbi:hypothetical protein [Paracoccus sp. SSJ]|uniref:hypothetical protein n=1 Tax=Paracoccus sp. SSJ TaxID=3050636 RepID=UPI002551A25F|nr:hypothetical protein [Paracoccus sp. SSJ]
MVAEVPAPPMDAAARRASRAGLFGLFSRRSEPSPPPTSVPATRQTAISDISWHVLWHEADPDLLPADSGPRLLLELGPFAKFPVQKPGRVNGCLSMVLRPLDGILPEGADMTPGCPVLMQGAQIDPAQAPFVLVVGSTALALATRDRCGDLPIYLVPAEAPNHEEQWALVGAGVTIPPSIVLGAVLRNAAEIVTDRFDIALAARQAGLAVTAAGEAASAALALPEVDGVFDPQGVYGFALGRPRRESVSTATFVAAWKRAISEETAFQSLSLSSLPREISHLVIGAPAPHLLEALSQRFGPALWVKPADLTREDLSALRADWSGVVPLIVNVGGQIPASEVAEWLAWCGDGQGIELRDVPAHNPFGACLNKTFQPLLALMPIVLDDEGKVQLALARSFAALTAHERRKLAIEGEALRPALRRLPMVKRSNRFSRVEMARRFGTPGPRRLLVLGRPPEALQDDTALMVGLLKQADEILYLPAEGEKTDWLKPFGARVRVLREPLHLGELALVVDEIHVLGHPLGIWAPLFDLPLYQHGPAVWDGETESFGDTLHRDIWIGWFCTTCLLAFDPLTEQGTSVRDYAETWLPSGGDLSGPVVTGLTSRALDPSNLPAVRYGLLSLLSAAGQEKALLPLAGPLQQADLAGQHVGLDCFVAMLLARAEGWQAAVTRAHWIWKRHGAEALPKVFTLLLNLRKGLSNWDEANRFPTFVLAVFRGLPSQNLLELGQSFVQARRFRAALTFLGSCLPTAERHLLEAECHIRLGQQAEAEGLLAQLDSQPVHRQKVAVVRRLAAALGGKSEESLRLLEARVAEAPQDYDSRLAMAEQLIACGRRSEAEQILLPLIRTAVVSVAALRMLAQLYLDRMETSRARGLLEAQLQLTPSDAVAWRMLADAHSFENDLPMACDCLARVLRLSPGNRGAYLALCDLEAEMAEAGVPDAGRWSSAFEAFLDDLDPMTAETRLARAHIRLQNNDFAGFRKDCEAILASKPDYVPVRLWLAHARAWTPGEKTAQEIAAIAAEYECVLVREADDNTFALLDAMRSFAQTGDVTSLQRLVRRYRHAMCEGAPERMAVPRYNAGLALGDYRDVYAAMRLLARTQVLRRYQQDFQLILSLDEAPRAGDVLLLSEGGVGDEIRYSALYPELAARLRHPVVSVDARLETLFRRSFPMIERFVPIKRYDRKRLHRDLIGDMGDLPGRDLTPFMTDPVLAVARQAAAVLPVPCALADLRQQDADFARSHRVRLVPDPALRADWARRLSPYADKLLVGLTWTSVLRHYQRDTQYFTSAEIADLLRLPGVVFVNCQYDDVSAELAWIRDELGVEVLDFPDLDKRDDFEGLTALLAELDLFVGTGTTTTELAAMTGIPTVLASPANMNAYRNPNHTETDRYYENVRFIRPIPATDRATMLARIRAIIAEEVMGKRARRVAAE